MPFAEEVYKWRRVVLVRLVRAVSGAPVADAPDIDDRGWVHDPASGTTPAAVHGPVFGMPQNADTRVKLERVRLDPPPGGPQLFLTNRVPAESSIAAVTTPASGTALAADGIITVHSGGGSWSNRLVIIDVRVGSDSGPVIFEFGVRVFAMIRLDVQPHIVRINGTLCATNQARIDTLRDVVNRVWRPVGLRFNFKPVAGHTVTRTGCITAGEVTTNNSSAPVPNPLGGTLAANDWTEFNNILLQDRVASHINIHWVVRFTNLGVAAPNQHNTNAATYDRVAWPAGCGIIMNDTADGNDLAHEIGHFLSLNHPDENAAGASVIEHVDMLRRLMYSFRPFAANAAYRANVGYGANQRGALVTMRNRSQDRRDNDWNDSRTRARNPY